MPLKDNKSWADPISNRIQIKIQKNVSKSYEKENEREREARPCRALSIVSSFSSLASLSWGVTHN